MHRVYLREFATYRVSWAPRSAAIGDTILNLIKNFTGLLRSNTVDNVSGKCICINDFELRRLRAYFMYINLILYENIIRLKERSIIRIYQIRVSNFFLFFYPRNSSNFSKYYFFKYNISTMSPFQLLPVPIIPKINIQIKSSRYSRFALWTDPIVL